MKGRDANGGKGDLWGGKKRINDAQWKNHTLHSMEKTNPSIVIPKETTFFYTENRKSKVKIVVANIAHITHCYTADPRGKPVKERLQAS